MTDLLPQRLPWSSKVKRELDSFLWPLEACHSELHHSFSRAGIYIVLVIYTVEYLHFLVWKWKLQWDEHWCENHTRNPAFFFSLFIIEDSKAKRSKMISLGSQGKTVVNGRCLCASHWCLCFTQSVQWDYRTNSCGIMCRKLVVVLFLYTCFDLSHGPPALG